MIYQSLKKSIILMSYNIYYELEGGIINNFGTKSVRPVTLKESSVTKTVNFRSL